MARKVSKISALLGMESKARARKAGSVDVAKVAGTKVPRMLFNTFGGANVPILESVFEHWETKRNKLADSKMRKHQVDQKYHKDSGADKAAQEMVAEARKSREDSHEAVQASKARAQKQDAYNSAIADQGSSQIKMLGAIRSELVQIKGVLSIGGRQVGVQPQNSGGGLGLGTIWNLLPNKMKGKFAAKAAGVAEKFGGKRIGSLIKLAAGAAGAEGLEKIAGSTAAEVAGSGLGAAAKSVAPEAAGAVAAHASGGILGKLGGFGKSALSGASGLIDSGKGALGKAGGWFKGLGGGAEKMLGEGVGKLGGKEIGKLGGEEAGKLGGKMLLKEGGKAIPLLGNVIGLVTSLGFAGKRLWEGDVAGAAMEGGSGLLNLIPGVGNYLSIAADLAIAGRDLKKAHAAGELATGAGKTGKEISEEGAKVVEEKADAGGDSPEGKKAEANANKQMAKLKQVATQLSPISTASAEDVPVPSSRGKIMGITAAGAATAGAMSITAAKTNTAASPLDRLVSYMAGLFDLATDDQKGIYVRAAQNALDSTAPKAPPPPPPPPATTPSAGSVSTSAAPSTMAASAGHVSPSSYSSSMQVGGTDSGSFPSQHTPSGKLQFDVAAGQPGSPGSNSSSIAATKSYGKVGGFDIDSMWDQMRGTIAQGESGAAGYDAHHGGTIHGLTNMSIGQLKRMTGAMGKYQLIPGSTLGMAAKAVGLSDSDLFSPANQEAMGKYLFAHRVKLGAPKGAAGIQQQLANEWASLPKDATGAGAYDGDAAGNMAAGGSARGQALASMISGGSSGSMTGTAPNTADTIDSATQDVAKASTDNAPTVIVAPSSGGGGRSQNPSVAGTGGGLAGPMVTRNADSSVQALTQNFIAGSSAMS